MITEQELLTRLWWAGYSIKDLGVLVAAQHGLAEHWGVDQVENMIRAEINLRRQHRKKRA